MLSASAIETSYGYWVPSEYQGELERKLGKVEKKKAARFVEMGKSLQLLTDVSAMQSLRNNYIDVVNERLRSVGARSLTEEEMKDIETRFLRRVQRLRQALGNQVECNRLAKILEGTPVPEIWEDPQSRNEMIQSFCEYVSWKLDASGRMPRIVGKLKKVFNLVADDEARSVQAKIDRFFLSQRCDREAWK